MSGNGKNFTKLKFEERIRNELNIILRRDLNDSRMQFVSITKVELSPDKSHAKVYWDTFDSGKRGEIKKALDSADKKLRFMLGQILKVRSVPMLEMIYDNQYEEELNITKILDAESKLGKSF